ncbi:Thiosulfate sulfurtransferase, rhodanese [Microbacterium esteraromaticum]|uniref:Thiosulfate sulfurtransferase, rhodanese n=1 Tax=Microbacterium esteraromaticum TaxID=57043 RepID=A0A1R4JUT6_9MICO|nr:sulfurtransferase [Microbacterium esteraromaticum]SJN35722.1 Thiosulfate sulfurtransferase, rhodanese [Microbacterium esteraromaticum]
MSDSNPLISVAELSERLDDVHLLDVRWQLGRDDGREQYLAGHIPGAVFVDVESDLTRHGEPHEGRHPLPDHDALAAAAQRWGIRQGASVVVYDGAGMLAASRAWWALRRAGLKDVRVLDGGWQAWLAAGGASETGETAVPAGDVVLESPGDRGIIDTSAAGAWTESGVLVDARAAERYRGETEPLDPIAGHIPGARNLPIARLLTDDGRFVSASDIAAAFDDIGADADASVAAYCGSGITAAQLALAGAIIGKDVTVYPGSWSAWSNTPGLPVATGAE